MTFKRAHAACCAPLLCMLAFWLAAAGAGASTLTRHWVLPSQADPRLTGADSPSLAMAGPRSRANGLLAVFLPGTGGSPQCCQLFLRRAVALGYLAIGLTYDNETALGVRCLNDLACFGTVRRNVFDGTHKSSYSALPQRDGIQHRLTSLLAYLAARFPREGWRRFLRAGKPVWSRVVMSGHSQGGGEAAFIGTLRRLRGVVALSSPPDTNLADQPATWVASVRRGATSPRRLVAFLHSGDPFGARILADWNAIGLAALGPETSVDSTPPPYGHTHELTSSAPLPPVALAEHTSTAVDSATPRCADGSPEYAPVWGYMLELAGGLHLARGAGSCGG